MGDKQFGSRLLANGPEQVPRAAEATTHKKGGARHAFFMATLEQYFALIINFVMIAAVSRLLLPSEIGIGIIGLGIGAIVFSFREIVSAEFLIKRDQVSDEDIRTSFTIMMSATLLLCLALYLSRGWLADFYRDQMLYLFLNVIIVAAFVESLSLPIVAVLRRDMAFGPLARIRTAASLAAAIITVGMAFSGFGYMSFAFGVLGSSIITTGLCLAARPLGWALRPSLASIKPAMHFGIYIGGTAVLNKIYETLPQLLLGRIMPLASVGLYNRANAICGIPDRIFLSAVFSVAFPVLSQQVREGADLRQSYLKALSYITVVYWPAQVLVALLAYPAVHIILGPNWDEAVPIVQILCLAGVFWFPVILTYPLLIAVGENREAFAANLIGRSVSGVILCTASFWGLTVLALSQFISLPFQMVVALLFVRRHVKFSWVALLVVVRQSVIVTVLTLLPAVAVVSWSGFSLEIMPLPGILAGIAGVLGWLAAVILTRHPFAVEIWNVGEKIAPSLLDKLTPKRNAVDRATPLSPGE